MVIYIQILKIANKSDELQEKYADFDRAMKNMTALGETVSFLFHFIIYKYKFLKSYIIFSYN